MTDSNSPKRKTLGIKPPAGTATRKPSGNRPVRVSDLNRKRVQAVAEGIKRAHERAGEKSAKRTPSQPEQGAGGRRDNAAGRPARPARNEGDRDFRPARQGRPADGERQARPRRFEEGEARPRRFGDDESRPRRYGDENQQRPRRFDNGEPRPRRTGDDESRPRRFGNDESRPRRFGDDESRPRRYGNDNSQQRPRRFDNGESRPSRAGDNESRPRRFGDDESRPRRYGDDNSQQRPRRFDNGESRPRRAGDDESRPRRFSNDEQRPRRYGDDSSQSRPRRPDTGESRPRRFGDDEGRQRRAPGPDDRRREGAAPARRFSDTADRARPARPTGDRPARQPDARTEGRPATPANTAREPAHDDGLVRLSKRMSELGLCSRREADEWIPRGWVLVDGKPVTELGSRIRPDAEIEILQAARSEQGERVTVLLNKPVGFVSGQAEDGYEPAAVLFTAENQWEGDPTRKRFAPWQRKNLAPAGRLDIDSTGLLVLTQDGRVARALIGEDSNVEKEYLVRVTWDSPNGLVERNISAVFPPEEIERLRHGLSLDGVALKPAKVSWQNEEQLRFVLREGRKRQIRRMCEQVGLQVVGLKRVRMGRVVLGDLPPGQWRFLGPFEKF